MSFDISEFFDSLEEATSDAESAAAVEAEVNGYAVYDGPGTGGDDVPKPQPLGEGASKRKLARHAAKAIQLQTTLRQAKRAQRLEEFKYGLGGGGQSLLQELTPNLDHSRVVDLVTWGVNAKADDVEVSGGAAVATSRATAAS